MEIKDYGSNSYRSREKEQASNRRGNANTQERKEKVTSGKVSTKKQSIGKKVSNNLFVEDIAKAKDYVFYDIMIPAAKKLISEGISSCVDILLYGETRRRDSRSSGVRRDYTRAYDERNGRGKIATRNGTYDYEDVIFETIGDANLVLDEMWKDIEQYGMVSIGDMYDHAGVTSERFTDYRHGWDNLRNADVGRNSDGTYYLRLPKVKPLD